MNATEWRLDTRLAWHLAALMLAAIALAGLAVAWLAVSTARSLDDAALQVEARTLAAYLGTGPDGRPVLALPPALRAALLHSDDRSLFAVTDTANHLMLSSDPANAELLLPYLPARPGIFRVPFQAGYRDGLVGAMVAAGPWRLAIAQGREKGEALADTLLARLLTSGLAALVPIGLATVLVGILTVRRGLRPVRAVSAIAATINPAQPGARLPEAGLPGEIRPLVAAMNAALARLETALDGQRRFVGDAAHALRTPLAVLTARLDGIPDGGETASLRQDAERMARLVDQLLKMTRAESVPLDVVQPVVLRQVAVEVISLLAPAAIRRRIELVLTEAGPAEPVCGNHAALVTALTNLLENALALAPSGSTVEVELVPPRTIRVLDRGPGVPEVERGRIFSRFQRGASAQPHGAGLGLAIVTEIAAAHHGRVWVDARAGGGSVFTLELGGMARDGVA